MGKVSGVHIFGEHACELVNYGAEVVNSGDTIFDMLHLVFPAVTYHNLYHHAATEAKGLLTGTTSVQAQAIWRRIELLLAKSADTAKLSMEESFESAFRMFDVDGSGFVCAEDLAAGMSKLGIQLDKEEVAEMIFNAAGGEGGAELDYRQFAEMIGVTRENRGSV